MTDEERIEALAQDIYVARHNQENDVTGDDLTDFLNQTITWVNQFIPELEKAKDVSGNVVDWNFVRNMNETIGTVTSETTISYDLPADVRKVVIHPNRPLTIQQDSTIVSTFALVNPNQAYDPNYPSSYMDRATSIKRKIIFSRELTENEVGGDIVVDTIDFIPQLAIDDVTLLDLLDDNLDIRQLFVLGVVKNQILPDIVQGGLTPSYAKKYDDYLRDCIMENNASTTADYTDTEDFGGIGGVGF